MERQWTGTYIVHITLEDIKMWPGMLYTALSRFTDMTRFVLMNDVTWSMLDTDSRKLFMSGRKTRVNDLERFANQTKEQYSCLGTTQEQLHGMYRQLISLVDKTCDELLTYRNKPMIIELWVE